MMVMRGDTKAGCMETYSPQTVDKLMRQSIDTHGGIVKGGW